MKEDSNNIIDRNTVESNYQFSRLGAIPLSNDILYKANIGLWAFELDEGEPPRMYVDDTMLGLLGLEHQVSPEETYHAWYDHIDSGSYDLVAEAVDKMMVGHAEVQYPWHHPNGKTMIVRCGGVRNPEYKKGIRIEGTHQDVSIVLHYQEESSNIAKGLEKAYTMQFQVVYYMDVVNCKTTLISGDEDAKKFLPIFNAPSLDIIFKNFHKFYVDAIVHEDDREKVKKVMSVDNILKTLKTHQTMSVNYRARRNLVDLVYTEMRISKVKEENGELLGAVVTFRLTDDELKSALEQNAKLKDDVLNDMLSDDGLFLINLEKDTRKTFHNSSCEADLFDDDEHDSVLMNKYIDNFVVPKDRELVREATNPEYIKKRLEKEKSFTIIYRDIASGVQRYYQMKTARFSDNEILRSFSEKDKEIVDNLIFEKLEDNYFVLYGIDIETGLIQSMKESKYYKTAEVGKVLDYSSTIKKLAVTFDGETEKFFNKISDVDYVRRRFLKEDKITYTFKSDLPIGSKWVMATEMVLSRNEEGSPVILALGFSLLDEEASKNEELKDRLKEDMVMIGGIAEEYMALFYVNMDEGTFKVFSMDSSKVPGLDAIFNSGATGPELLQLFGKAKFIHAEDRHIFENVDIDYIRERLVNNKRFSIRFRQRFATEYRWMEMDFIKYEAKNERANAIAIGFADRDQEIRSEQTLNNCLTILGETKPAKEAIDELLSMTGSFYGAERAYIFEYQPNTNVYKNTYEWCDTGIVPMIDNLTGILPKEVEGWLVNFEKHGAFYMDVLDNGYNTQDGIDILAMQGITNLVAAPIINDNVIIGFIGVDNPTKAKKNITVMKNVAAVAYSIILKGRQFELAKFETARIFADTFLDQYVSTYYVSLKDCSQVVISRSQYVEDAYGYIDNYLESINKYISECVHIEDQGKMYEAVQPSYIRKRLKDEYSFSTYMRDISNGELRWYRFDVTRGADDDHAGLSFMDVTEKLAEERENAKKLEDALQSAESANRSKTSFLFNMSHDIRTPMNAITGFTSMAKKYAEDKDKVTEYLDKIDISGKQLLSLINQVLEMARIESGKIELENEPLNIHDKFQSLVTVLSEQAKVNGLEFFYNIQNIKHADVIADDARMESIALNIAGNAMKYTPKGGRVDFSIKEIEPRREGRATFVFTVSDTGIGMSEEYLRQLFEPFSREKSSTVSKIQGTGLGMSIVKNLVDLMGGNIEVQSELGKGTKFDVTFDLEINNDVIIASEEEKKPHAVSFVGKKLLLVEDNEMNREIATDILSETGLIIETAEDGQHAVNVIKEKGIDYFDFVLMDIQMPIMNGYEATAEIRKLKNGNSLPIIALSANAFKEDMDKSIEAGMNAHVAKPIDVDILIETLRSLTK